MRFPGRLVPLLATPLVAMAACTGPTATSPTSGPSTTSVEPPPCMDARLLYAPSQQRLLLAGCVDQVELTGTERVWAWDGSAWEILAGDGPPATVVSGIAYDIERQVLLRYGGLPLADDQCVAETWEWAAERGWRQADAGPPLACDHVKMAYDAVRGITLLTGGGDGAGQLVPGAWAWDGAAWTRISDDGPPPRAHHGFVFDVSHARALLYGGYDGTAVFDDLWSWDGEGWSELGFDGPGPRSHAGMAVGTEGLLLFGGAKTTSTFGSLTDETWYLTDGSWRQLDGEGPSARGLPAVGYDPGRDVMVLYGGFGAGGEALDDLWEWNGSWTCVSGCG